MTPGCEWVVDAGGCSAAALASRDALESLFASLIEALDLYCCRPRPAWDFEGELRSRFGASSVRVRRVERSLP